MDTGGKYTGLLYAQPSFAEGIARILDFGDTLTEYNRSSDPDTIAIRADWNAVGEDLERAINHVAKDLELDLKLSKR